MHIWTIEDWIDILDYNNHKYRDGLRLKFDSGVNPVLRADLKSFAKWLRKEYFFPIRVPVYLKNKKKITCLDGSFSYGTFFRPFNYSDEPYIRIAVGDFNDLVLKWGKQDAEYAIFACLAHELTHYFQWINDLKLTEIGEERQATRYQKFIMYEYVEYLEKTSDAVVSITE